MEITKNTRLIVIIGYCFLAILVISGFAVIYPETVKYQNSLGAGQLPVKLFGLVILIVFPVFVVAVFFISWSLKLVNTGIELQKKIQDIKKSEEKLLISREQLIDTITRDIKAPVNAIIDFLDLLRVEEISQKQQSLVKDIYFSATHILDLIKNLLDFQSLEKNQQETNASAFSPYALVNDIYAGFQLFAHKKNLIFKFSSMIRKDRKYIGDPYLITQILNHLISNSIKFTPRNGLVSIRASIEKGDIFRVSVKDSGPGVSEKDKQRIFEEFIRLDETKKTVEGTGLGLTVSQKLSSLLNGNIEIKSQKGQGADFILTVPLVAARNEPVATPDNKTVRIPDNGEAALNRADLFLNEMNNNLKLLGNALDNGDSETVKQISRKMVSLLEMFPAPEIVAILNLFEKGEQPEQEQVILAGLIAKKIREIKALRETLNDKLQTNNI